MSKKKIGVIIQARTGSSRLKKKMLLPFGEESTLLGFILSKISKSVNIPIVLATSTDPNNKVLGDIARQYGIPTFFGSENDVLERFIETTKEYGFDNVIRICADNPFISMEYLTVLIERFEKDIDSDYLSFQKENGTPVMKSHLGYFAEAITSEALLKAQQMTDSTFYHEHVTNFIYENEDHFNVKFIPVPKELDREDYRLTLDTEEDYEMLFELEKELSNKYNNEYDAIQVLAMVENMNLQEKMVSIINKQTK